MVHLTKVFGPMNQEFWLSQQRSKQNKPSLVDVTNSLVGSTKNFVGPITTKFYG